MNRRAAPLLVMLLALTASGAFVPRAYADGSAGVVVEHGDGSVDTYCVAFSGDSISGPELLAKAGLPVVQWDGAVCAVGSNSDEGCFAPHDFSSCYCKSYPPTNQYWSFFNDTQDQGWVYSALGFQSSVVHNGDMQAWRWGVGGPASAPPPPAMTFAQVCGAAAATPPATATPVAPTSTSPPPASTTTITPVPTAAAPIATITPMSTATTTATPSTAAPSMTASASPTSRITNHGTATATPAPAKDPKDSGGSSGVTSLAAFGAVVVVLGAAIGAALIYRRRQGGN